LRICEGVDVHSCDICGANGTKKNPLQSAFTLQMYLALTFENFCQVHLDCFFAPDEMNHDTNQVIKSCVCVCVCLYMYTHTNTHTHTHRQ